MPRSAAASHDGRLTPDRARQLAQRRWQHDPQGLNEAIDKLDKRRAALTDGQRQRLAEISEVAASAPGLTPGDADTLRALLPSPDPQ